MARLSRQVGSIGEKGISLLLYKNARVDQAILDEAFGIYGWQRSHMMIGNSPVLYREYLGPGEKRPGYPSRMWEQQGILKRRKVLLRIRSKEHA
mgnify:CR=1 FL=1